MSSELKILAGSAVLGLLQIILAVQLATRQKGLRWNMGPRDVAPEPLQGMAGRMDRALQNFKETFPIFVAAIFLVQATGRTGFLSSLGAEIYLIGRVLYVPLYAMGIPYFRTLVWAIATFGIALVLYAAF